MASSRPSTPENREATVHFGLWSWNPSILKNDSVATTDKNYQKLLQTDPLIDGAQIVQDRLWIQICPPMGKTCIRYWTTHPSNIEHHQHLSMSNWGAIRRIWILGGWDETDSLWLDAVVIGAVNVWNLAWHALPHFRTHVESHWLLGQLAGGNIVFPPAHLVPKVLRQSVDITS